MENNEKKYISYEEYVLRIAESMCKQYGYPQKKHYSAEIAKQKTENESGKFTPEQVRSSVSRAIDKLCDGKENHLLCIRKKYYVLNTFENILNKISIDFVQTLRGNVIPLREDILIISHNMCGILLQPTNEQIKIKSLLEECLGDNCYKIIKNREFFYIMLKCPSDKLVVPDEDSNEFKIIKALAQANKQLFDDCKNSRKNKRLFMLS